MSRQFRRRVGDAINELEGFVRAHYGPLFRTAYLLTGDHASAEDLLQDALVRSWAYAQRARIEQPGAFVRRCMVNLFISQGRRRVHLDRLLDQQPVGGPVYDVADDAVTRQDVWSALSTLPRHQRALLVLRFYEDLTETQIAAVLGVGVGAVRSGTWRAMRRLREAAALRPEGERV